MPERTNHENDARMPEFLDMTLNRSALELMRFANFYEGHGWKEQASEIHKLIRRIRSTNQRADVHSEPTESK